jgi:hypothetical protein
MKLKDFLSNLFGGTTAFDPDADVQSLMAPGATPNPVAPAIVAPADDPATPAFTAEMDQMRAEFTALRTARVRDAAAAFADEQVRDCKALPAQREMIAGMFTGAALADSNGADGGAQFAADGAIVEGANMKALRDFFTGAPAHHFTNELVVSGQPGALFGADQNDEQVKKLLSLTPLGRAAMPR